MRNALGLMLASVLTAVVIAAVWFWTSSSRVELAAPATVIAPQAERLAETASAKPAAAPGDVEVTAAIPDKAQAKSTCANPNALGVSRVVEIDTTGGPGFGFEHFKQLDFLTDKEVVFFPIGKHATYHPEILKQVAAAGHTVGAHTWSHANLNSKKISEQQAKDEIEKGYSAVKLALGAAPSPFFRFPELQHNPAAMTYLGSRNVAIFSCDLDSFDFRAKDAGQIVNTVMSKLDKQGKGIILMHDFQKHTAEALPTLLGRLKAGGYKIVQMKAKAPLQTLPEYDEALVKDMKVPVASTRPVGSVVQTVSE